jgi:hypothetical protein
MSSNNWKELFEKIVEELAWWIAQGFVALPTCPPDHRGVSEAHRERCTNPGKTPLVRWRDLVEVTQDELQRWLGSFTAFNVALRMGAVNHLIGLDIDGPLGEELLAKLCPDLPPTVEFKTPGGGRRLLFYLPDGVKLYKRSYGEQGRIHEELAILGEGTITVMPPSVHADGGVYAYKVGHEPWTIPFAEVPASVIRLANGDLTVDSPPAFDREGGEAILAALAAKCPRFERDWGTQRESGVPEDAWFCWCALLVGAGHPDAAWAFSTASAKHNTRSSARIQQLIADDETRGGGTVRCTRLGCTSQGTVWECFKRVDTRGVGNIVNTPGSFIAKPRKRPALDIAVPTRTLAARQNPAAPVKPAAADPDDLGALFGADEDGNA